MLYPIISCIISYLFPHGRQLRNPALDLKSPGNGISLQSNPDVASHKPTTYVSSGIFGHLIQHRMKNQKNISN